MNGIIASPMNYIGGKYKILPQILPLFPENIGTFIDLFCGGCNVGINVPAKKTVFNDNLTFLVDLYKSFNSLSVAEILNHIETRIKQFNLSLINKEETPGFNRSLLFSLSNISPPNQTAGSL